MHVSLLSTMVLSDSYPYRTPTIPGKGREHAQEIKTIIEAKKPSGASGGSLHGSASFKVERLILLHDKSPKDPAVLKKLRDSELLRRSISTTPPIFTMV